METPMCKHLEVNRGSRWAFYARSCPSYKKVRDGPFQLVIESDLVATPHFTHTSPPINRRFTGERKFTAAVRLDLFCSFAFALGKLCQRACPSTQPEFVAKRWKLSAIMHGRSNKAAGIAASTDTRDLLFQKIPSVCLNHLYPSIDGLWCTYL